MEKPALVAIDLGAESCRVSLLRWQDGAPDWRVVHRFPNAPVARGDELRWDVEGILRGVTAGLRLCGELAGPARIAAIGVDGWAVDYARVAADGRPVADPFCYRDERNVKAAERVHERLAPERLYRLTGIQFLRFNTVYQLYADGLSGMDQAVPWVNLPEYVVQRLGGERVSEYTNATHTELVDAETRQWCAEIFRELGLNLAAAPRLVPTGTVVGRLAGELTRMPAFRDTQLIVPACHDTASAIAGIPAEGDDWAFISSGTWSLVGTTLERACVTDAARRGNFTNLGGAGGTVCFLKNVNGMWILRQCLEEWHAQGHRCSIDELIEECASEPEPDHLLDVDDPEFLLVGGMPAKINAQRVRAGFAPLAADHAGIVACASVILHSLAGRYAVILRDISAVTGKRFGRIHIVGGGSRNAVLNRLTAERTGLQVVPGSPESTTVGNFAIQLAALESGSRVTREVVARWSAVLLGEKTASTEGREVSAGRGTGS